MRHYHKFLVLLMILLVTGCASRVKVKTDVDLFVDYTAYHSFSGFPSTNKTDLAITLNASRVFNAIRQEMANKGLTEDSVAPDLVVEAMAIMKDKRQVVMSRNYNSFSGPTAPAGFGSSSQASESATYSHKEFKEGSLIITITDAKEQKIIWRGACDAKIKSKTGNAPVSKINNAVREILKDFPPLVTKDHVWLEGDAN